MDFATPNLPSINFDATEGFYSKLGFERTWRDDGWMILKRGQMVLEFFPHPELKPEESWFSCCLRLEDMSDFYANCRNAGLPEQDQGWPRLRAPNKEASGLTIGYMVDLDGTLLRLIQN